MAPLHSSLFLTAALFLATALVQKDNFRQYTVHDLDVDAFSSNLEQPDPTSCSIACVLKEDCPAFDWRSDGDCHLFMTANTTFPEKTGAPSANLWIRDSKQNQLCSIEDFPIGRGRSRYRIQSTLETWPVALASCEERNGKLVELTTAKEQFFVSRLAQKIPNATVRMHIGLLKRRGAWVLSSSGGLFEGIWSPGQPDNRNNSEDWGAIDVESGLIHDVPNNTKCNSICECMIL